MSEEFRAPVDRLAAYCEDVLRWAGADAPSAHAATQAMMHGSIHGVDSHGVRLLEHYARAIVGGRINSSPTLTLTRPKPATGLLEADDAHGALATYVAMDHACDIATETGIAAVGIRRSSHFGPAGAYTLHAAKRGYIALTTCNSDSFVRLHDGAAPFHGTNPISMAVPAGDGDPWLLDMATSSVPFNRVRLYQSLNLPLPDGAASDGEGADTNDPRAAEMLAPVGGAFGFKGAGLGGMAEILSAVLTGMRLSPEIPPMVSDDMTTLREMGAFVLAIDPEGFVGSMIVAAGMRRYLDSLRASPSRHGARVMAPGDREWAEAARRHQGGVPLDPETCESFRTLSADAGFTPPWQV